MEKILRLNSPSLTVILFGYRTAEIENPKAFELARRRYAKKIIARSVGISVKISYDGDNAQKYLINFKTTPTRINNEESACIGVGFVTQWTRRDVGRTRRI